MLIRLKLYTQVPHETLQYSNTYQYNNNICVTWTFNLSDG